MTPLRWSPEDNPPFSPPLTAALVLLLTRSAAMGVLVGAAVTTADGATMRRLVKGLQRFGIGGDAGHALAPLMAAEGALLAPAQERQLIADLGRLNEALEVSAAPAAEWPSIRAVFGDETLGGLLEIAPISLRRYAEGERATPDAVAARLHWLALVVADLAGAYNDFGMRRWFERPRSQLGGRSPRQALGRGWSPDDAAAARVRALSSVLSGAQPLAA